jgi:hypothetical protein
LAEVRSAKRKVMNGPGKNAAKRFAFRYIHIDKQGICRSPGGIQSMPKVISYDEAMKQAAGTDCGLLLGNGFSIQHFNYKTLLEKSGLKADEPIRLLFDLLETVDFERVVKTLEDASIVETVYGNDPHSASFWPTPTGLEKPLSRPCERRIRGIAKISRA